MMESKYFLPMRPELTRAGYRPKSGLAFGQRAAWIVDPENDSEAELALLRANAADSCDDRVTEDIFDVEDEHAEVELIKSRRFSSLF